MLLFDELITSTVIVARSYFYLPTFALCYLAIPEQITTLQQSLRACVGNAVFIPSYVQVSALADDVEVIWFRLGMPSTPADNGAVTANYSYKVDNVTMSDEGQYVARVTVPNQPQVQGPNVRLNVGAKPGEFLVTTRKHPINACQVYVIVLYWC